jgi:hypothetical protein
LQRETLASESLTSTSVITLQLTRIVQQKQHTYIKEYVFAKFVTSN